LGHVIRKTVSEMTYNVSSGTCNFTIPYDSVHRIKQSYQTIVSIRLPKQWSVNLTRIQHGALNAGGIYKKKIFRPLTRYILQMIPYSAIVTTEGK